MFIFAGLRALAVQSAFPSDSSGLLLLMFVYFYARQHVMLRAS